MHQAAPVTIAKLRWLLGKATPTLGDKRLADLSPKDVYAWRLFVLSHALESIAIGPEWLPSTPFVFNLNTWPCWITATTSSIGADRESDQALSA